LSLAEEHIGAYSPAAGRRGVMPGTAPDIESLYRDYAGLVYRRVLRFYSREEAEEVLQEVFLRAMTRLDGFRGDSSPATWLYQLTTRYCLNRIRNERRRRDLWVEQGEWAAGPTASAANQEAATFLRRFWQSLDEEMLEIGVAYLVDGMTHADIAAQVGCSRRTVGNRLEALQRLARERGGRDD
jgi:RNA polymerase sigma-70 factor (ECF subfamily)